MMLLIAFYLLWYEFSELYDVILSFVSYTLENCNTKLAINCATVCHGNQKCHTLCWLIQNKSVTPSLWGWYDEV